MTHPESDKRKGSQLSIWDYLQMDTAEREEDAGVPLSRKMSETDSTKEQRQRMLEKIANLETLEHAAKRVRRNKGASGVDGMKVQDLEPWLKEHGTELQQKILDGKYRPQAVLRVEIPKDNGKTRKLGIPTVIDRMVQQAICLVLNPLYEAQFSENSYGFRPNRSAHMALEQAIDYANEGYVWVVDMDLEKFFDAVNQSKLVQLLSETLKDGRVISLIHKFLRAGILKEGLFEESEEGVPQGGPLSPLLGNILLNECDRELEQRGHRFVRYADDLMIFCKSRRAAQRVLVSITKYLEEKLFLKVNREKTQVAYLGKVQFLGHGFYKGQEGFKLCVAKKSWTKLKAKVRELTARSNGMSIAERKRRLNSLIRGWVNYFKLAKMKSRLEAIDAWLRRRLRMVTWKRWKLTKTKYKNLLKTKLNPKQAWYLANTRNKYWYVAGSPWMQVAIPNAYFELAGYLSFSACYADSN